jgi:hypothetical protein
MLRGIRNAEKRLLGPTQSPVEQCSSYGGPRVVPERSVSLNNYGKGVHIISGTV